MQVCRNLDHSRKQIRLTDKRTSAGPPACLAKQTAARPFLIFPDKRTSASRDPTDAFGQADSCRPVFF
ncbi:hypothetical protein DQG13_22280 [Paenibacillus sp. YN15]|nr:hypothetical protein DQG13_22280 [Paenibacillus sp. YN15]